MDWITKALGLAVGYYAFRGMLGKSRDGDMKIFLALIGVILAIFLIKLWRS